MTSDSATRPSLRSPGTTRGVVPPRIIRAILATAVIAAAALHPAHGLGIDVCPCRRITHLPCPGCGITRSMSCTVRGRFAEAVAYNPFGPLVIAICLFALVAAFLPSTWTSAIRRRLAWTEATTTRLLWVLSGAFIAFGVVRAVLHAAS